MGDLPIFEPGQSEAVGIAGSTSYGKSIARGFSTNTKGVWSTFFTPTHHIRHLSLTFSKFTVSGSINPFRFLVDLGVGSQVYVPDILVQMNPRSHARTIELPVCFTAGTAVQVRMQASAHGFVGPSLFASGQAYSQGFAQLPAWQQAYSYGVSTGSTSGTQVDPGGTANTKGSWTQITAGTSARHVWLFLCVHLDNSVASDADWRVDLGVGGSGSETVILADKVITARAASDDIGPNYIPIPMIVPASTRLAVRAQCSITDATDRLFDCSILGLG